MARNDDVYMEIFSAICHAHKLYETDANGGVEMLNAVSVETTNVFYYKGINRSATISSLRLPEEIASTEADWSDDDQVAKDFKSLTIYTAPTALRSALGRKRKKKEYQPYLDVREFVEVKKKDDDNSFIQSNMSLKSSLTESLTDNTEYEESPNLKSSRSDDLYKPNHFPLPLNETISKMCLSKLNQEKIFDAPTSFLAIEKLFDENSKIFPPLPESLLAKISPIGTPLSLKTIESLSSYCTSAKYLMYASAKYHQAKS